MSQQVHLPIPQFREGFRRILGYLFKGWSEDGLFFYVSRAYAAWMRQAQKGLETIKHISSFPSPFLTERNTFDLTGQLVVSRPGSPSGTG